MGDLYEGEGMRFEIKSDPDDPRFQIISARIPSSGGAFETVATGEPARVLYFRYLVLSTAGVCSGFNLDSLAHHLRAFGSTLGKLHQLLDRAEPDA